MRLIDADALEEFLLNDSSCLTVFEAIRKTQSMPTIDAVPVVRCRECRSWTTRPECPGLGRCSFHEATFVTGNGFCYWSQRREDGIDA